MLAQLLEDATVLAKNEQKRMQLVRQMASSPDEVLPIVLKALHQPPLVRQMVAYEVVYAIGYPANASVIPDLIEHLGDPNRLAWDVAVKALAEMPVHVVVPHLMNAILDQGRTDAYWSVDIEGRCLMLTRVPEFARLCCPAVTYLLAQKDLPGIIDRDYFLDVIEVAGNEHTYALPSLFELVQTSKERALKEHAQRIIASFPAEVVRLYEFSIAQKHSLC